MRFISSIALVSGLAGLMTMAAMGCDGGGDGKGGGGSTNTGAAGGTGGTSDCACEAKCEAKGDVASDCIAITDNKGLDNFGLRMAQLTLEKPAALTSPVVAGIIEEGVTMNLKDCNLNGGGTFSWLMQFDTAAGMLKTGGGKPQADPTAGYCFVNETLGTTAVAPLEVMAKPDADGKFTVETGGDVVVPIFLDAAASMFVLLPLKNAKLLDVTLSADQNCMGKYNACELDPADSCEPGEATRYTNAGKLDAIITLEDADSVVISSLNQSLCVLLTGDGDGATPNKCKRDADMKIVAKGDWCSTDNMAMSCQDSYKLGAQFAASAVKVTGDCQ